MNAHARLASLASTLRAGTLSPEDREQLADKLAHIANGEDAAAALGLKRSAGQRTWHTCAALAERDRLLRDAAARFFAGFSIAEQAHRLNAELSRYRAGAWTRERMNERCPERHLNKLHECLWHILKANDHVLTPRSLRLVLATNS